MSDVASQETQLLVQPVGILSSVFVTLFITPTHAADVSHGEQLARRWCTPCHVVASDQKAPTGEAPPFSSIARAPNFDAARLTLFLLDPHPKMPDMGLSRTAAADLAAYIASLK
jgi:mono/diheme cytochrome c family protein